jgi:hypothetical protein
MLMFYTLFQPTPVSQADSRLAHAAYTVAALLVAAAMFLAASGSGNPATVKPLPDWVNTGANVLCMFIGFLVLLPRFRAVAAIAAALNMAASMVANYQVDGYAYFVHVLPFNIVTLSLSLVLAWHYRRDLARRNGRTS